jgi:hypothetical protein
MPRDIETSMSHCLNERNPPPFAPTTKIPVESRFARETARKRTNSEILGIRPAEHDERHVTECRDRGVKRRYLNIKC